MNSVVFVTAYKHIPVDLTHTRPYSRHHSLIPPTASRGWAAGASAAPSDTRHVCSHAAFKGVERALPLSVPSHRALLGPDVKGGGYGW
jgi:hypothetical protein